MSSIITQRPIRRSESPGAGGRIWLDLPSRRGEIANTFFEDGHDDVKC